MTDTVAKTMGALAALAASVWVLWSAWVIAVGGDLPLLGWGVGPSAAGAVLFLIVAEPAATTVAYWVATFVCLPLMAVPGRRPPEVAVAVSRSGRSLARSWGTIGSLVLGVDHLRAGQIYHLGFDLGEYRGTSQPPRSHRADVPDEQPREEPAVRYVFEPAMTGEMDRDRAAAYLSRDDVLDSVREVPAPQQQARAAFAEIRSAHVAQLQEAEAAKLGVELPATPARRDRRLSWVALVGGSLLPGLLHRQRVSGPPH